MRNIVVVVVQVVVVVVVVVVVHVVVVVSVGQVPKSRQFLTTPDASAIAMRFDAICSVCESRLLLFVGLASFAYSHRRRCISPPLDPL
jgi:heme/copper-type cytochrome/quinol oxidase subunit 2